MVSDERRELLPLMLGSIVLSQLAADVSGLLVQLSARPLFLSDQIEIPLAGLAIKEVFH